MAEPEIARKLTVIFYADVAGYSRLMGLDEVGTHRTVSERLDDLTERIAASGGTVLRYAGDAVLATFDSAVAAVETAAEAQSRIADDNRGVDEDRRIRFRIGVNLGEVIVDRNEVFGDGVNLAARLEAAAEAGGVCISAAVHDQVAGKVDAEFEDGGEREFKNIARPVRVYHWRPEADVRPKPAATEAGRAPPRKSRRSRCCPSTTFPAIPSRNTSRTASPRTLLRTCRRSRPCSSSPAIPRSPTRVKPST